MTDEQFVPTKRPLTVTVAAWILILPAAAGGVFVLLSTVLMMVGFLGFFGGAAGDGALRGGSPIWTFLPFMLISLLVSLILPVGLVLTGIGLLRMRTWARATAMTISVLVALLVLGPVAFGNRVEPLQVAAGLVVPVGITILLLMPSSRDAFADAREQEMI